MHIQMDSYASYLVRKRSSAAMHSAALWATPREMPPAFEELASCSKFLQGKGPGLLLALGKIALLVHPFAISISTRLHQHQIKQ